MDDVEYATSEEFARTRIQPRIQQDWYENNAALLTEWLQKSERYRPPRTVADTWVSLYAEQVRRIQEDLPARRETELRRVTEAIAAFERNVPIYDTLVASKNHYIVAKHRNEEQRRSGSPHTAAAAENERHRIRHRHVPAPETFKHNSFLPSRFATELVRVLCRCCLGPCGVYACALCSMSPKECACFQPIIAAYAALRLWAAPNGSC